MVEVTTYSEARANFSKTMDKVCEDHTPVIITRQKGKPVVMMSLEDYNALDETAYLLTSPANRVRLMQSIEEAKAGNLIYPELNLDE